jgi:hypothetical protein
VDTSELAAQQLSYLNSINYEYAGFVHPLTPGHSLGVSVQYLGSGNIAGTDVSGNSIGNFSSYYASYNLSYGQVITDKLSLGVTGKVISASLGSVGASAYAFDVGSMYKVNKRLTLAGVLTNVGTKLTFLDQQDSLPMSFHMGASYEIDPHFTALAEWVYEQTGVNVGRTGLEWRLCDAVALRAGYRSDTSQGLSSLSGFTMGIGLKVMGQEFSYAWVPMGALGNTQYFSVMIRFGGKNQPKRFTETLPAKPAQPDTSQTGAKAVSPSKPLPPVSPSGSVANTRKGPCDFQNMTWDQLKANGCGSETN